MTSVHGISVAGGTFPAQIWRLFMSSAIGQLEPVDFPEPKDYPEWADVRARPVRPVVRLLPGRRLHAAGDDDRDDHDGADRIRARRAARVQPAPEARRRRRHRRRRTATPPATSEPPRRLHRARTALTPLRPARCGCGRAARGGLRRRRVGRGRAARAGGRAAAPDGGSLGASSSRCSSLPSLRTCGARAVPAGDPGSRARSWSLPSRSSCSRLQAPLLLSTDAWTYWEYGQIAAVHDGDPYVDTPSEFPDDPAYDHAGFGLARHDLGLRPCVHARSPRASRASSARPPRRRRGSSRCSRRSACSRCTLLAARLARDRALRCARSSAGIRSSRSISPEAVTTTR